MTGISRRSVAVALAAITLLAVPSMANATTFDEYVEHLRGDNDVLRSLARQWLPREGAKAIRPVLPLIYHENPSVSWAAVNVVQDIANDVSVPGREAERAQVADALLAALAANSVQEHQFTLLRILPIVVPEGADLGAIAALLQSENTRERARVALQEINTAEARAALREALPTADATFACALMDAIGKTGDPTAFPLLRTKLDTGTDAEKAAAALALAQSADPALVQPYLALCKAIDINHRPDAEDAALRLGQALATAGGRWEAGMALYRELLAQSESRIIQGGAIAGLGRYGDETAFDTIMAAWAGDASGLLEAPAMAAIESLQDPGVADKLLAAYAGQPLPVQERLLGIMGRKRDARYLPAFESATAISPAVRLDALQQSRLPEAIPLIETLGASGDATLNTQATSAIATMAATYRDAGDLPGAGRAYLALYRLAGDETVKASAMEGIKSYPVPEAYDTLKAELGDEGLLQLPTAVLAGMARVLAEAGRADESNRMRTALISRASDTATVQQLIQLGPVQGTHEDLARSLGFIMNWHVAGAFAQKDAPTDGTPVLNNGAVDLAATYETVKWEPKQGGGGMAIVDLTYFGRDNVRIFAYATVNVTADTDAVLRLGTDDGVRAWVNGEKIHENIVDRGTALDSDLAPVKLKAGENAILLEILQNAGGTNYCARLTQPDGLPLAFEQQ